MRQNASQNTWPFGTVDSAARMVTDEQLSGAYRSYGADARGGVLRTVQCADAMVVLDQIGSLPHRCHIITSLPDIGELKPHLAAPQYEEWFVSVVCSLLRTLHPMSVAIFYQTDGRHSGEGGCYLDKSYLCHRGATAAGAACLWHRIVCAGVPGQERNGRPGYAHLLCFSMGLRLPRDKHAAIRWSDVIPARGHMSYAGAMGESACAEAVSFCVQAQLLRTRMPSKRQAKAEAKAGAKVAATAAAKVAAVSLDHEEANEAVTVPAARMTAVSSEPIAPVGGAPVSGTLTASLPQSVQGNVESVLKQSQEVVVGMELVTTDAAAAAAAAAPTVAATVAGVPEAVAAVAPMGSHRSACKKDEDQKKKENEEKEEKTEEETVEEDTILLPETEADAPGQIFDPFCGQGTVLAIANALGMDAWGIDIKPQRCAVAFARVPFAGDGLSSHQPGGRREERPQADGGCDDADEVDEAGDGIDDGVTRNGLGDLSVANGSKETANMDGLSSLAHRGKQNTASPVYCVSGCDCEHHCKQS